LNVQAAAVSAVNEWSDELATPILLDAVQSASLRTRQEAQAALQARLGHDVSFPVEAGLAERQAAVRQWAAERGLVLGPAISTAAMSPVQIDDPQREARLVELLQSLLGANDDREARLSEQPGFGVLTADQLDQLRATATSDDVGLIEQHLVQRTDANAETILREVLPTLSPLYATLAPLAERDVALRRQAARQLALAAVDHPLSPVFLQRLHARLTHEQDQQVWQSCLAAIQRESHPEAGQIALLALHSTWPDVRRLGVDYIAQHPTSDSAAWLLPAFRDPQRSVRLAAIATAGRCGHPLVLDGLPPSAQSSGQPGLRPLLTDVDAELRQAALLAMARLRDEQACQELVRLTFDSQPATRETAVRAMGQSGQARFVEPLLKLLWTEPADGVRLAILTSLETLVPVENQPPPPTGLAAPPSIDDKVHLWTAWWTAARNPVARSAR
jgi:HEAT repeat protein